MRLCSIKTDSGTVAAATVPGVGHVLTSELLGRGNGGLLDHLERGELPEITAAVAEISDATRRVSGPVAVAAPYRRPRKILGIGLNYGRHAQDLGAELPRSSPASFIKGDHTIIGPDDYIRVPPGIGRVTAEAELGLVIGRRCYQVDEEHALDYVAFVCAVIDMTAESVLLQNPRYLTRSKNYPTFFSFGPDLLTLDEVGDLSKLSVSTVLNGTVKTSDLVAGMTFSPAELLSFHSQVMPMLPGDILSTGTPGAVEIHPGDLVTCRLGEGLIELSNPVR